MRNVDLSDVDNADLHRDLEILVATEPEDLAGILAHIAEVDARRLYLSAGFPSMLAYCVVRLNLSAPVAMRRIRASEVARQFPRMFEGVARGRLGLGAIMLLAPYLTEENAEGLIEGAEAMPKFDLEQFLFYLLGSPDSA